MFRMELLSSVYIRAIILCFGFLLGMYKAYNLKLSVKTIVDVIVIFVLFVYMSSSPTLIMIKMVSYLVTSYALLMLNHTIKYYYAAMFSFVILFMMSISDLISLQIINMSPYLTNAITYQDDGFAGFLAVMIPSFIVAINYYFGGIILYKINSYKSNRVAKIYLFFSTFYVLYIMILSITIEKIINSVSSTVILSDLFNIVSMVYLSTVLIPFFSIMIFREILKNNLTSMLSEEKLLLSTENRLDGYRFTHNFNNIIQSINYLAKNNEYEQIKEYLDKLS